MQALVAIALGVAALGGPLPDAPEPVPLTDVQREMIESGMFEPDSFREPAFEALVENVRSWAPGAYSEQRQPIIAWAPDVFSEVFEEERGELCSLSGTVRMVEPIGEVFPGVTRLAVERTTRRPDDRLRTILVFLVDEAPPEIGARGHFFGRIYKVMPLQTQRSDAPTLFPAIVARTYEYDDAYVDDSEDDARFFEGLTTTLPAVMTALSGALAVVLFIVIIGRRLLDKDRPRPRPLASSADPPDDEHHA